MNRIILYEVWWIWIDHLLSLLTTIPFLLPFHWRILNQTSLNYLLSPWRRLRLANEICVFADSKKLELGRAGETICDAWPNIQTTAIWISLKQCTTLLRALPYKRKRRRFRIGSCKTHLRLWFCMPTLCKAP